MTVAVPPGGVTPSPVSNPPYYHLIVTLCLYLLPPLFLPLYHLPFLHLPPPPSSLNPMSDRPPVYATSDNTTPKATSIWRYNWLKIRQNMIWILILISILIWISITIQFLSLNPILLLVLLLLRILLSIFANPDAGLHQRQNISNIRKEQQNNHTRFNITMYRYHCLISSSFNSPSYSL